MNDLQLCRAGYAPELVKAHREFTTRFGNNLPISVYKEQFWDTSVAATFDTKAKQVGADAYADAADKLAAHKAEMDRVALHKVSQLMNGRSLAECDAIMQNKTQLHDVVYAECTRMSSCGDAMTFLESIGEDASMHDTLAHDVVQRMRAVWKNDYRSKHIAQHDPEKFKRHFGKRMGTVEVQHSRPAKTMPALELRMKSLASPASVAGGPPRVTKIATLSAPTDLGDEYSDDDGEFSLDLGDEYSDDEYSDSNELAASELYANMPPLVSSTADMPPLVSDTSRIADKFADMPPLVSDKTTRIADKFADMPPLVSDKTTRVADDFADMPPLVDSAAPTITRIATGDCSIAMGWLDHYLQKNKKAIRGRDLVYFAPCNKKAQTLISVVERATGAQADTTAFVESHLCVDNAPASPVMQRQFKPMTGKPGDTIAIDRQSHITQPTVTAPRLLGGDSSQMVQGFRVRVVPHENLFNFRV